MGVSDGVSVIVGVSVNVGSGVRVTSGVAVGCGVRVTSGFSVNVAVGAEATPSLSVSQAANSGSRISMKSIKLRNVCIITQMDLPSSTVAIILQFQKGAYIDDTNGLLKGRPPPLDGATQG
jgi:hypothetical protein